MHIYIIGILSIIETSGNLLYKINGQSDMFLMQIRWAPNFAHIFLGSCTGRRLLFIPGFNRKY